MLYDGYIKRSAYSPTIKKRIVSNKMINIRCLTKICGKIQIFVIVMPLLKSVNYNVSNNLIKYMIYI